MRAFRAKGERRPLRRQARRDMKAVRTRDDRARGQAPVGLKRPGQQKDPSMAAGIRSMRHARLRRDVPELGAGLGRDLGLHQLPREQTRPPRQRNPQGDGHAPARGRQQP